MTSTEPGLAAFFARVWQFHAERSGRNAGETFRRTVHDVVTHYGVLPDEALAAVRRLGPTG